MKNNVNKLLHELELSMKLKAKFIQRELGMKVFKEFDTWLDMLLIPVYIKTEICNDDDILQLVCKRIDRIIKYLNYFEEMSDQHKYEFILNLMPEIQKMILSVFE